MKRNVIISIFLMLSVQTAFAQGKLMADRFQTRIVNNQLVNGMPTYDAEGSPYLDEEFVTGTVYVGKSNYSKILMRYNIYEEAFEFKVNEEIFAFGPNQSMDSIRMGKHKLVVHSYESKGKVSSVFLIVLDSGKMELFVKKSIYLKPAEEPKAMQYEGKPAVFKSKDDTYYVRIAKGSLTEVESLKKLIDMLPDQKQQLEGLVKREKLKSSKESDMLRFAEFYNSL